MPFILPLVLCTGKYRGRVIRRLGAGLDCFPRMRPGPRIWIHALSLGEVVSSRSLVKMIRFHFPEAEIFFSSATRTGEHAARDLKNQVDRFVPFPLDLAWSVSRFVKHVRPDLFILVETDFWPNFLMTLSRRAIPSILVNGRISEKSFYRYGLLHPLFRPLFSSFRFISMQTEADARRMIDIGIPEIKVKALGNLKYDSLSSSLPGDDKTPQSNPPPTRQEFGIPPDRILMTAGSTHEGEEEIILAAYKNLSAAFPELFLAIAPRNTSRGERIMRIAGRLDLTSFKRTGPKKKNGLVMILDTMGELQNLYRLSDFAFVGGSLVRQGGHNPLEPAALGKPVIFGPHMEDFAEISRDLLAAGGAIQVKDEEDLRQGMKMLIQDPENGKKMGQRAKALVAGHNNVTRRHIDLIRRILNGGDADETQ